MRFDGSGNLIASEGDDNLFLEFDNTGTLLDTYPMRNADGSAAYDHYNGDMTSLPAPLCEPSFETAWGFGPGFLGKNWATYIVWEVCCD